MKIWKSLKLPKLWWPIEKKQLNRQIESWIWCQLSRPGIYRRFHISRISKSRISVVNKVNFIAEYKGNDCINFIKRWSQSNLVLLALSVVFSLFHNFISKIKLLTFFRKRGDGLCELGYVVEAFINRGKAHIGYLVDFSQLFHSHFADELGRHFFVSEAV